ncbi:hypothetical protein PSCICJ_50750 [Pseudomonas cichorii]|nr:hypothetical protein PSCICJ_50750 [Pseudomonas cichorii]
MPWTGIAENLEGGIKTNRYGMAVLAVIEACGYLQSRQARSLLALA